MHDNRPEETEADSLESAARHTGRSLRPTGETSDGEWEAAHKRETEALLAWAEESGLLIPPPSPSAYAGRDVHKGMEHTVWFDGPTERWFKFTHKGEFGRFPHIEYDLDKKTQKWCTDVVLRIGTPGEYLERQLLGRSLFGDDVTLDGVVRDGNDARVLISQAHIVGKTPKDREIQLFMSRSGFFRAPNFAWYNPISKIAAFDAQARNFLRTGSAVVPIDLILTPVEGELQSHLAGYLTPH